MRNKHARCCNSPRLKLLLNFAAKLILLLGMMSSLPGCALIGVETVAPRKTSSQYAGLRDVPIEHTHRTNAVTAINCVPPPYTASAEKIIRVLGVPSEQGTNFIRYRTGKRAWRGVVIDLAIFPIPLSLPLIVPGGKTGYVDFVFDQNGYHTMEYETVSKFYGYAAGDDKAGFVGGNESGFWFHAGR